MNKLKYFKKEISYIKDESKKRDLEYLINLLPDYFFTIPASSSGKYHPKFALTNNGLVKHTKVAVRIAIDLFETINNFSDNDKDLIIIALIMHDGLKKGKEEGTGTKHEHPLLVSQMIMENTKNLEMDIDFLKRTKQKKRIQN